MSRIVGPGKQSIGSGYIDNKGSHQTYSDRTIEVWEKAENWYHITLLIVGGTSGFWIGIILEHMGWAH